MSDILEKDNKKLIAVDLDGTLLKSDKTCSLETANYLKELKEKGNIIVIATGRILRSALTATKGAEFANYIISDAGARIYDVENKETISKSVIDNLDIVKICSSYQPNWKRINICDEQYYNIYTNEEYKVRDFENLILDKQKFLENCKGITHISVVTEQNEVEETKRKLQEKLPHLKFTVMQDSFSDKKWVEIFNDGTGKYNAVKLIAEKENIDCQNIISFGDALNDIEMIRGSGVGVAMGNALEEVKKAAKFITLSNDEDGIKVFLEKYNSEDLGTAP